MARLPQPGGDNNNWGNILNQYLSQSHDSDGNLNANTVGASQLKAGAIRTIHLSDGSVTNAKLADNAVTKSDVGLSDVDNTSDNNKPVSIAQQNALDTKASVSDVAAKLNTADLDSEMGVRLTTGGSASQQAVSNKIRVSTGVINAVQEYGLSTTGNATANTTALSNAIAAAIANDLECYVPAGVYSVNPGIVWDAPIVRFRGAGSKSTVFAFSSVNDNGFVFGQANYIDDLGTQGWVGGFGIKGPVDLPPATANYKVGITYRNLKFSRIFDTYERSFDIGYTLIGNCYGTRFDDIHARYSKSNIGLDLRTHTDTGNDIPFYNCWLSGKKAALNVSGALSGGYSFFGGQMAGGSGVVDDDSGVVRLGKAYTAGGETSEIGRLYFDGTLFENPSRNWQVRAFTPFAGLDFHNVTFNSLTTGSLGVYRQSNGYHDRVTFQNTRVEGTYDALLSITQAAGGDPTYIEQGTIGRPVVATITTDLYQRGMIDRAGLTRGIALQGGTKSAIYLDALRLRNNAGALEKSTDGTTWNAVSGSSASTAVMQYTSSQTNTLYTIPTGAKLLSLRVAGNGGGGGSGRRGAAGTLRTGGGGGASGAYTEITALVSELTAVGITQLRVTVGAVGAGGAAVTTDDTNGNLGGAGGSCFVITGSSGAADATNMLARAAGGLGGAGGTMVGSALGGIAQTAGKFIGSAGGASSATGAIGGVGSSGVLASGGGGGGISTSDVASGGGAGGYTSLGLGTNTPAGAAGASGSAGANMPVLNPGFAGGGGGAAITGVAGAGGAGGRGAGGGAGGASLNGLSSGAGGAGGIGFVEITALF